MKSLFVVLASSIAIVGCNNAAAPTKSNKSGQDDRFFALQCTTDYEILGQVGKYDKKTVYVDVGQQQFCVDDCYSKARIKSATPDGIIFYEYDNEMPNPGNNYLKINTRSMILSELTNGDFVPSGAPTEYKCVSKKVSALSKRKLVDAHD